MKIKLFFLAVVFLSLEAQAQVNVPVFGKIRYLKGYVREIEGENINYNSALPEIATTALLTRCTDGKYAIEWETEAVPVGYTGKDVYFAWLAAYSVHTSSGDRDFDLYLDGRKALTFRTYKDKRLDSWSAQGGQGEMLVFDRKMDDAVADAHGYMYLKVPATLLEKGKPVRIRVVGEAAGSRDWYMTFKYEFAESLKIQPVSLLTTDNRQPMQVIATHFGDRSPLTLLVAGKEKYRFMLEPGLNEFEIYHPAVDTTVTVPVEAWMPGDGKKLFTIELKPVSHREIYLIHHSHYDVGYSHRQEEVVSIQNKNIEDALRYIDRTRDLPEEARFRWNIETTLAIENYLSIASAEQQERLLQAIREGSVGVGGLYAGIMTGICQPEELFELTRHARQLEEKFGIDITAAMITDIPGLTWATVPALVRSGIRYFSDGPNYIASLPDDGDRVGYSNRNWKDRPFWWVSPSGEEKLLFWMAGKGYSSWHGFKAGEISSFRGKKKISAYMEELDRQAYPYEMVQWRYNIGSDNGPTDSLISRFVLDWNRRYSSPKMILSTVDGMFREFEKRYGDQLPSYSGDFTPYWEDGAYSTAAEMVMNRKNSNRIVSLATLYAIRDQGSFPVSLYDQAWKNILLWDEHTWGAHNSITDPDIPFVTDQWKYKQHYALRADSLLNAIEDRFTPANTKLTDRFDVFNTLSWQADDVVYLYADDASGVIAVTEEDGNPLIFQHLTDGRIAVRISVPPLSASRIVVNREANVNQPSKVATDRKEAENRDFRLKLDENTGSINSLVFKPLGVELVDTRRHSGLNEFLYVPGRDPAMAERNGKASVSLADDGPVLTRFIIKSDAPGCNSLTREITVFRDLDRVEIVNTIDKKAIRDKEAIHFAFPFNVTDARERFNTGWGGIFEPGAWQLAGSNQDYYSVQQWCDVSGQDYGVSLLLREACLIEPGSMIDERPGKFGVKVWKKDPDTTPVLYSYVMNNYWHTNFKADQEGPVSFTYGLVPHGMLNTADIQKKGIAFNRPLILMPAGEKTVTGSLFTISNPKVVATTVMPVEGGLRIRLFNTGGAPESFRINWINCKPSRVKCQGAATNETVLPGTILNLPAFGILELVTVK